ncbi:MAG: hypothetical protein J1D77_02685 [Muribaculaceae bacterium]|nr:hypothetical protein [Muribaculaceae bacterium]
MILRNIILSLATLSFVLTGCRSDYDLPQETETGGTPVVFGANIVGMVSTRALEVSEGEVVNGEFSLTFFNASNQLEVGKTVFTDGLGVCYRYDKEGNPVQLIWEEVGSEGGKGLYSFWLDNLELPDDLFNENFTKEELKKTLFTLPENNPYRASKMKDHPEIDLLWGRANNVPKAQSITIDLQHAMAAFQVRINMDNAGGQEIYPVKVYIENLCTVGHIFNRNAEPPLSAKTRQIPNEGGGTSIRPDEYPFPLTEESETIPATWEKGEENGLDYYISPEFILPPHGFVGGYRGRLYIELNTGEVYSGLFPMEMYVQNADGTISSEYLRFKQGCKLKITVTISKELNELGFEPVYYYEWYDKGTFNIMGSQASLADDSVFKSLIEAYNQGKEDEFYKWGYQDSEGRWMFNLFNKDIKLKASEVAGQMEEKLELPYDFVFHNATVIITTEKGDKIELNKDNGGAEKLKKLLSEGKIPGVNDEENKE